MHRLRVSLLVLSLATLSLEAAVYQNKRSLDSLVYTMRDAQTDSKTFRTTLSKIGEYMGLEVLDSLDKESLQVTTRMGTRAVHSLVSEKPVLITVLRAGIPLLNGLMEVFPDSEIGFLGMARNEATLLPTTSYIAIPEVKDQTVIIADTMLATAGSMIDAIKIIEKHKPKKIIVVCAIASEGGIARLRSYNPQIPVYAAAIDPTLNEKGYIVPGLGDAGDIAYGEKLR